MSVSSPIQVRKSIMTFLSTLETKYQHIRYLPSAVHSDKPHERTYFKYLQDSDIERQIQ